VEFVVLQDVILESDDLIAEIQTHVRERLAAHEYPRRVRVIEKMPVTLTGKIKRCDLREMEREWLSFENIPN
jgi:acyl-coenzyme A synthetase/AMP-(fatty) acid ligase